MINKPSLLDWISDWKKSSSSFILFGSSAIIVFLFRNTVLPNQINFLDAVFNPSIDSFFLFVFVIYGVFGWGIYEALKVANSVDFETDIARAYKSKFREQFDENGLEIIQPLESIKELVESNPDESKVLSLMGNIYESTRNKRIESPYFAIQRYSDSVLDEAGIIFSIQKLSLQLGILGTFLGLVPSLANLINSGNVVNDASFQELVKSLSFAFGTSIAGLESTVVLGIFSSVILRRKHDSLLELMNSAAQNLLHTCKKAMYKANELSEIEDLAEKVGLQNEKLDLQNIATQTLESKLNSGIQSISSSKNELDKILYEYLERLSSIYEHFSAKKLSEEISQNMDAVRDKSLEKIDELFQNVSGNFSSLGNLNESIEKINSNLESVIRENNEMVSKSKAEIFETLKEITKQLEVVAGNNVRKEVQDAIEKIGKDLIKKNGEEVKNLRDDLEKLNSELVVFNSAYSKELQSREPVKILLQIGNYSVEFVKSVVLGIFKLIRGIFTALFKGS